MILLIRGQRVIVDTDLAALYRVKTKALNQAIKRNRERFPSDFMFRLAPEEKAEVVTSCDLRKLRFSPVLLAAFTELGTLMAAAVSNSPRAIAVGGYVVRAFVRLRDVVMSHQEFARKLRDLKEKLAEHDERFAEVCEAIRELMQRAPLPPKRRIGFSTSKE